MTYVFYAVLAGALAVLLTPLVRKFAFRTGAVDVPRPPRNLHEKTIAKLGGLAVFLAFAITVLIYVATSIHFDPQIIPMKFVLALLGGGAVLMIGGFLDDKYELPPYLLAIFPVAAALIVVFAGIGVGITFLSNPFGGTIDLNFKLIGIPGSAIFIFLWMNGMMFTTKFLDGLDGLVAGIGLIAGLTLFALSLGDTVSQPITASFAIILAGALAGYLIYAFHPASIFFGEGGSTFVGFVLGVLSVILGGKIATALLVMGIPILDVAWVIVQRLWSGKSPFRGDRLHIHFKLMDLGFSQKQTALILYGISAVFGFIAVFLQSMGKLVALGILFGLMVIIISFILRQFRKQHPVN